MPGQSYIEEINEVWNMVKESFRSTLSETTVNLWFGDLEIISFQDTSNDQSTTSEFTLTMGIASEFKFKIIQDKYLSSIQDEFCRLLGFDVKITLSFTGSSVSSNQVSSNVYGLEKQIPKKETKTSNSLQDYNFEYTFENFIVGSTNKFAHAACTAVAANPRRDIRRKHLRTTLFKDVDFADSRIRAGIFAIRIARTKQAVDDKSVIPVGNFIVQLAVVHDKFRKVDGTFVRAFFRKKDGVHFSAFSKKKSTANKAVAAVITAAANA